MSESDATRVTTAGDGKRPEAAGAVTEDGPGGGSREGLLADGGLRLEPAARLGRYTVIRLLGQGGMGVVYAAYDELLDRRVAVKLVRVDSRGGDAQARILREAKALAQLSHPNVVQIYEVSASAGRIFIAMEYVRGSSLGAVTGRLRAADAAMLDLLDLYVQAGRGLAAAHAEGLVHRDFKPDNVIVGEDGRTRVIDFGLATVLEPEVGATVAGLRSPLNPLTSESVLLGTPAYMSPEQLSGRPADARSDQFSFCVALYEALGGVRPFAGDNIAELSAAIRGGALHRVKGEALPRWLLAILQRGLAADPAERFPSMDALLAALSNDPGAARRRRLRVVALAFASAAIAALLVILAVDLRERWADRRREHEAEAARVATEARIRESRAAANELVAREAFTAFVEDPAHDGTEALARAWLDEAERHQTDDDLGGARAGFAAAYANAPTPTLRLDALRGLADVLRRRLDWDALANLLALVDRQHPEAADALADLRIDTALAHRDIAAAHRLLAGESGARAALTASLLSAAATPHRNAFEVHAAGRHLALLETRADQPVLHIVNRDPALSLVHTLQPPKGTAWLTVLPGEPLQVVARESGSERNSLYRVAEGVLEPLHVWHGARVVTGASVDLDRDGAPELYLGTSVGLEILEVVAGPSGYRERVVYTAADTLESMPLSMVAADLDGDGRDELAASFAGWYAYDVRLLGRGADGHLVTKARDKIGSVFHLTTIRGADGRTRLLFRLADHDENTMVFPPGRTRGDAEGLYLQGFDGRRLTRDRHLPPSLLRTAAPAWFRGPFVGDVDGNGHDDIVGSFHDGTGQPSMQVQLQGEDGGFTPVILGHLRVLEAVQLDDDPAYELLVGLPEADHSQSVWVLGAGDDALPPAPAPTSSPIEPVDADDPVWTRRWRQAAALEDLGLHDDAAAAFERLARGASIPALRAAASLTAGRLRARLGEHRPALALLHEAARAPEHRADALREALTSELQLGDYEAAQADLNALADGGGEVPERLAQVIARAREERVEIRFDRPLDPAWRIENPLAVRHVPGDDALDLATTEPGVLLSLPVEWSGDLLELVADVTLMDTEYPTGLDVALEGGRMISAHLGTAGTRRGGTTIRREFWCYALGHQSSVTHPIATGPEDLSRLEIRISIRPTLGDIGCDISDPASGVSRSHPELLDLPLPAGGRYRLIVRGLGVGPSWLRARLHRITVRGVRIVDEPASDRAAFHRALVESDPGAALTAFAALPRPTSSREQLWQAHALLQVGRVEAARGVWVSVLAAPEPPMGVVYHLLRAYPELYGPFLRESADARWLELLGDAWRPTATNHIGDTRARRALRMALAPLDAAVLLAAADPELLARACELLGWRARVHAQDGDTVRARADLEGVLAAIDRLPAEAPVRVGSWRLWLELASLAAREGQPEHAREAVRAALTGSAMPMLVEDVVRARPELTAFAP